MDAPVWGRGLAVATATLLLLGLTRGAWAADAQAGEARQSVEPSNAQLLRRIESLESEVKALKAHLRQQSASAPSAAQASPATQPDANATPYGAPPSAGDKAIFGLYPSPIEGLKFGAYGEFKLGSMQNPDANGQWQNGFDGGRLVLLPSYEITDNISFDSEIEFEHGGIAFDQDDKLHGTAEIEQAFIDFKVRSWLNFHSPGIDLVPIGYTNQTHEPTTFYSVQRPELANGLIPTTFFVPSWGTVYGQITDNLGYQFQVSESAEDFGDSFDARTDARTAPGGPYAAGVSGQDALGLARPPVGDFTQLNNAFAYAARMSYTPRWIPGLAGSTSAYFSPNIEPRGAHSDAGIALGNSSLTLVDTELRYRVPDTGWEFRGEYVQASFGTPANMRANNDSDPTNNVGDRMYGFSGEMAYHFALGRIIGSSWEAVPFYRYTYEDLQTGAFAGTDANTPTGSGRLHFHDFGVAVFPSPKLVMKLDYTHVEDRETGGADADSILGGIGFFF